MFVSVALALLAATAVPAEAAAPASTQPAAPAVKAKKICRTEEAVTGSLTPKRTCKTKVEWDALLGRSGGNVASGDEQRATSPGGSND